MASSPRPRPRSALPLADIIGRTLAGTFRKQGFAAVEIITHWEDIVGPELARRSEPMRLVWPKREDPDSIGILHIRVEGAYAIELQHLAPVVIERVNRYFGWRCVGRLKFAQGPITPRRKKAPTVPEPAPEAMAEVAREIGPFEHTGLGTSLARLGAFVRQRRVTRP
jgi:hypothetical protein